MSLSAERKLKEVRSRLQQGDAAGASYLCEQILGREPGHAEALCLLGIIRLMSGSVRDAIPLLQRAAKAWPDYGLALEHLGLAHLMAGDAAMAEGVLQRAAALSGAPPSVHMRLGLALLHQERVDAAITALQRAVALAPEDVDCHLNLGRAFGQAGRIDAARSEFEAVLRLAPGHPDAQFNLGVLEMGQDNLSRAAQWFDRVIEAHPRQAEAHVNLGIVHQKSARLDAAIACFRRALEIDPKLAAAGNNLAHTLFLQDRLEAAREQYYATLSVAPEMVEAHEGLASVCRKLGRLKESIEHLRRALEIGESSGATWAALADALFQSGDIADAEAAAKQANALDRDLPGPYSILALVHIVRGEPDRAIAILDAGFQRTRAGGLLGTLAHQLQRTCDWERLREAWQEMARRLEHEPDLGSPFWLLMEPTTAAQQLAYTRRWADAQFGPGPARPAQEGRQSDRAGQRLRIGYLSSDLHEHATAHLFAGVLEHHDRKRFEVFAYSYGPEDHSALRARIKGACEHFADVAWDPDDLVVQRIRDDALDILVDLKGYTLGARTAILSRRPCPIQVNWLGYPATMGAGFIDYLIADAFVVPPGAESNYSERVIRLNHCWQCNDRQRPQIEPLTRREYGLPEDGFVFCCFTQAVKITPEILACWMRLLRRVPAAVLWLAADNPVATANLQAAARSHGIAPERIVFSPRIPFAQHLARYRVADLALDTFPYTSHSTASDGLWSGCPIVALCGDTFAARVSGSILTHAGLPDLITYSLEEYEALAHRLATDPARLQDVRLRVAHARASSLFDAESFARDLERIYTELAHLPALR